MSRIFQFPFNSESAGRDRELQGSGDRDRVAYVAHTDELTGLSSRPVFEDRLSMEMARSNRRGGPLSAMVLEVDRFERLDERKGEKAADSVLVSIARYLQETVRITDAVGRWGAGQFCVIMPDTELRAATLIADHLRERIGYKTFAGESGREFQVTCSVGLAQWNRPTETPREFPERLERALDTAREIGGNTLDAAPYRSASPELPSLSFEDGQPDPSKWGIPRTFFVVPEHIDQQVLIDSVS